MRAMLAPDEPVKICSVLWGHCKAGNCQGLCIAFLVSIFPLTELSHFFFLLNRLIKSSVRLPCVPFHLLTPPLHHKATLCHLVSKITPQSPINIYFCYCYLRLKALEYATSHVYDFWSPKRELTGSTWRQHNSSLWKKEWILALIDVQPWERAKVCFAREERETHLLMA